MAYEDYLDSLLHSLEGKSEEDTSESEVIDPETEDSMSEFEEIDIEAEDEISEPEEADMKVEDSTPEFEEIDPKPEEDSSEEEGSGEIDEYEFLRSFDEELMNSVEDDFMRDFEEELNKELTKNTLAAQEEAEPSYEDLLQEPSILPVQDEIEEKEIEDIEEKTAEDSESLQEDYENSDDEILMRFLGSEESIDDHEEEIEEAETQDIMDLLNSLSDDEDIADIGELLHKDENNEIIEFDDDKREMLEDIGESILKEAGDNITEFPQEKKKKGKTGKSEKKKEGFLEKLFSKKAEKEKKAPAKKAAPKKKKTKKPLGENEKILIEMAEEDRQEKKKEDKLKRKNSKAKKPKKEAKPKKLKLPKPVEIEEPYKKASMASIILIFLLTGSLLALTVLSTTLFSYSHDTTSAKEYFNMQQYDKAYEQMAGLTIKEKDQEFYKQLKVIMQVEKQYNSYINYKNLQRESEALDALLKGISKYDIYYSQAEELGVRIQFESIKNKIETVLLEDYEIDMEQAREIISAGSSSDYSDRIFSMTQKTEE